MARLSAWVLGSSKRLSIARAAQSTRRTRGETFWVRQREPEQRGTHQTDCSTLRLISAVSGASHGDVCAACLHMIQPSAQRTRCCVPTRKAASQSTMHASTLRSTQRIATCEHRRAAIKGSLSMSPNAATARLRSRDHGLLMSPTAARLRTVPIRTLPEKLLLEALISGARHATSPTAVDFDQHMHPSPYSCNVARARFIAHVTPPPLRRTSRRRHCAGAAAQRTRAAARLAGCR